MARRMMVGALVALAVGVSGAGVSNAVWAQSVPGPIAAALKDPARPAADTSRDAARKPGELLAFAGVKPGQKVADFVMGGGYFTRILSAAVGPNGHVYAYQPAEFIRFQASYGENLKTVSGAYKNVTPIDMAFGALDLPDGLDLILTVQNYHDLHLPPFAKDTASKVNAELFKSLKPGGVLVVTDHVGAPGSGLAAAGTVHRIEPSIVRQELEAAGFKYDGEWNGLRNSADPHTANVFDAAIRGKTDQFTMRFKKP